MIFTGDLVLGTSDREESNEAKRRFARYNTNRLMYRNKRWSGTLLDRLADTFSRSFRKGRQYIHVMVNFPGLISRACADLLFGEPPTFSTSDESATRYLDAVIKNSCFQAELYNSEISNSYRGDAVFRATSCPVRGMILETVNACNYYVEESPDSCRYANKEFVAWEVDVGDNCFVRVQEYGYLMDGTGYILNTAFLAEEVTNNGITEGYRLGEPVDLAYLYGDSAPAEYIETGVRGNLLQHIPNFIDDECYFGVDDYTDLAPLFEAVNNRVSHIDQYLDVHSRPKLISPQGAFRDMDGNIDLNTDNLEIDDESGKSNLPRYLTWDGQMDSSFKQLEYLEKKIFQISEMSQAIFGIDIATSVDSSMAMRQFFTRTKAKINRKRMIYDERLKKFIRNMLSYAIKNQVPAYDESGNELYVSKFPDSVDIHWQDGIPRDYVEQVNAEATRYNAGLTTLEDSIARIDLVSKEKAAISADKVRAEQATRQTTAAPSTMQSG